MKLAIFETEDWEERTFQERLGSHALRCTKQTLNDETAAAYSECEVISTFISSTLNERVLRQLPLLRLIITRSVGFDHIDLDYCRVYGVTVCNIPDYGDYAVAEHAFALLLAISRRIVPAVEQCRAGEFDQNDLRGTELRGKTLGVIGTGRIGRRAIEMAGGFGMNVVAFDVRPSLEAARTLGFKYLGLTELLAAADVVTLHIPGTADGRHILSDPEFACMKRGAILINTARGSVVDGEALVRALAGDQLSGVGLDVLPQERDLRDEAQIFRSGAEAATNFRGLVADHILLHHPKVLVTPHNAYNTIEAMHRIVDSTISVIESFAQGAPQNVVQAAAA